MGPESTHPSLAHLTRLAYPTEHHVLKAHPCYSRGQIPLLFKPRLAVNTHPIDMDVPLSFPIKEKPFLKITNIKCLVKTLCRSFKRRPPPGTSRHLKTCPLTHCKHRCTQPQTTELPRPLPSASPAAPRPAPHAHIRSLSVCIVPRQTRAHPSRQGRGEGRVRCSQPSRGACAG